MYFKFVPQILILFEKKILTNVNLCESDRTILIKYFWNDSGNNRRRLKSFGNESGDPYESYTIKSLSGK